MKRLFNVMIPALAVMIAVVPFFNSSRELYNDVLRMHILANSDSAADQSLKLAVRDRVLRDFSGYYDGCNDKESALEMTRGHLADIEKAAADEIRKRGFDYPVSATVGETYFNTRYYGGFTMPAGWYDALRLRIGEAEGQNWWCVMYPAVCVGAACEEKLEENLNEGEYRVVTSDRFDFRFKIVEYFEDFLNLFR